MILHQTNQRSLSDNQRAYLIGKLYKEEKMEYGGDRKSEDVKLQNEKSSGNCYHMKRTEEKIAKSSNVSPKTVRNDEKYAEAVDTIVTNTGINPFQLITGTIKAEKKDIVELAKKPVEKQKEIIEKVEKKCIKIV
jgi:hypothetical protein